MALGQREAAFPTVCLGQALFSVVCEGDKLNPGLQG